MLCFAERHYSALLIWEERMAFPFFAQDKDIISRSNEWNEIAHWERAMMIDLDEPALKEHLRRRTPEGRYEISDIDLVLNIRAQQAEGNTSGVRMLCEVLLERCAPEFQLRT